MDGDVEADEDRADRQKCDDAGRQVARRTPPCEAAEQQDAAGGTDHRRDESNKPVVFLVRAYACTVRDVSLLVDGVVVRGAGHLVRGHPCPPPFRVVVAVALVVGVVALSVGVHGLLVRSPIPW